jgi:hypothetical protein
MSHKNSCDHCSGKFGLVRWRFGTLQFCSKVCKRLYLAREAAHIRAQNRWFAYLARGSP